MENKETEAYRKGYQDGMKDWHTQILMVLKEARETLSRPGWYPHIWAYEEIVRRYNKRPK